MSSLEKVILNILDTKQPENVAELVRMVQQQVDASLDNIQKEVKKLHKKGLVSLEEPKNSKLKFLKFVSPRNSQWFWIIIIISLLTFASIVLIPETGTILSYFRYTLGFVLIAFLPGYSLTETLFPKETSLDMIEKITFSIGLSFAITALMGLFLSFTSIGLTLNTTLPTLGSLVLVLATVGLIRKYYTQ
ncbi:DUF1616 domain-containing protein [Candidatus Bathyarchaeota archaeon]|nr:DUF1616 domain-containing protein [Candidatus Bathyarchaeota archaeon]